LAAGVLSLALPLTAAAQSSAVYVSHARVTDALAHGAVLLTGPHVKVAGGHLDTAAVLTTERDTTILFVTEGAATLVAGAPGATKVQPIAKGDVVVISAWTPRALRDVSPSISYYQVTVPVVGSGQVPALGGLTFVDRAKVAPTLTKAGPIADGPNLKVSGGYRTGPYAPADYRPDVEVHATEADLFYVIDGEATLITGGNVIGGRTTAPGQIRGSTVEGGDTHHLTKGDVMWVPAGVPHWFPEIPTPLSYLLVKVSE
jgi:mannose-6-phosphate isomerase-like protein (cupin superfamily)